MRWYPLVAKGLLFGGHIIMYTVGWMSNSRAYFTAATMINSNSTGIKVFKLVSNSMVGIILLRTPLLFSLGFNYIIYSRG